MSTKEEQGCCKKILHQQNLCNLEDPRDSYQVIACLHNTSSGKSYGGAKLGERIGIVHPGNQKAWDDLIVTFQYFKGIYEKDGEGLSTRTSGDRTRGE